MNLVRKIVSLVANESAIVLYALSALVTAWVAFGFRASPAQTAAVATIGTAVVAIVTAFATRPVSVPVITGAVATIATASAAFGLHLTSAQIGAAVPVLSLVLSLVLRQAVTPLVTLKRQQAHQPAVGLLGAGQVAGLERRGQRRHVGHDRGDVEPRRRRPAAACR